ncbi:MAG: DUF86 domain-containing protein [Phycisphaerae bacterium]
MTPLEPDLDRVGHMYAAARSLSNLADGVSFSDFKQDAQKRYAWLWLVVLIGEAATKVSRETRERAPGVPWAQVTGTRNRVVHGYLDIDKVIVCAVATRHLDELIGQLAALLQAHGVDPKQAEEDWKP